MNDDLTTRLLHVCDCQETIISKQKEIINELLTITLQHLTVENEVLKPIVDKINDIAYIEI